MRYRGKRLKQGHTLVELLAVLGIVGVLAQQGIPAFASLINNVKITIKVNDLARTL